MADRRPPILEHAPGEHAHLCPVCWNQWTHPDSIRHDPTVTPEMLHDANVCRVCGYHHPWVDDPDTRSWTPERWAMMVNMAMLDRLLMAIGVVILE